MIANVALKVKVVNSGVSDCHSWAVEITAHSTYKSAYQSMASRLPLWLS